MCKKFDIGRYSLLLLSLLCDVDLSSGRASACKNNASGKWSLTMLVIPVQFISDLGPVAPTPVKFDPQLYPLLLTKIVLHHCQLAPNLR